MLNSLTSNPSTVYRTHSTSSVEDEIVTTCSSQSQLNKSKEKAFNFYVKHLVKIAAMSFRNKLIALTNIFLNSWCFLVFLAVVQRFLDQTPPSLVYYIIFFCIKWVSRIQIFFRIVKEFFLVQFSTIKKVILI